MEIKWRNLMALALVVLGVIVLVNSCEEITEAIGSIRQNSPGHRGDERFFGVIALGLLVLALLAALRILSSGKDNS